MPDETAIELNRSKEWVLAAGCFVIAAVGVWFLVIDKEQFSKLSDSSIVHSISLLIVAVIAGFGVFSVKKLRQSCPGLTLNQDGLTDQSSGVAVGFVPWSDITGIDGHEDHGRKFILIRVRNPDTYIHRGPPMARAVNAVNTKVHGTPINIPARSLRVDPNELWAMINTYFDAHRQDP